MLRWDQVWRICNQVSAWAALCPWELQLGCLRQWKGGETDEDCDDNDDGESIRDLQGGHRGEDWCRKVESQSRLVQDDWTNQRQCHYWWQVITGFNCFCRKWSKPLSGISPPLVCRTSEPGWQSFHRLTLLQSFCHSSIRIMKSRDISDDFINHLLTMSMILQEPTLFSGSLRFNLDPGNHFSDEALHRALNSAGLTQLVSNSFCCFSVFLFFCVLVPICSHLFASGSKKRWTHSTGI